MSVQVLVAAVNKDEKSLVEMMNIQTEAIVANQTNNFRVHSFIWNGSEIKCFSFNEKGVGLNRNNALMRATGEFCLFADDDMRYVNGYESIVEKAFFDLPDADVIVFNLIESGKSFRKQNKKSSRVRWWNFLWYGTARVAIRLETIRENGILFNLTYGGGTEHSHGEDNIFLGDCLKKGLKIYAVPQYIAELQENRASSWNKGYDEKYLRDQGDLYRQISKKFWLFFCLQDVIRRGRHYTVNAICALKYMLEGNTRRKKSNG